MFGTRRSWLTGMSGLAVGVAVPASAADGEPKHRLVLQVSERDSAALALNNAVNVAHDLGEAGEDVLIEIVAYGPGLHMFRTDTSAVKDRLKSISQSMPNVAFAACGNTMTNMSKAEGKTVELLPNVAVVKAGVLRIMELQEKGWSYVRP